MTQQAASARIRAMETQTGVALVRRSPRGSTLTDHGALVSEWGSAVLDAAHRVDTGLAGIRGESREHLTVVASQTIAEQLLPRWLVSSRASAVRAGLTPPEVTLTASNSDGAVDAVRAGRADLGFVEAPDVHRMCAVGWSRTTNWCWWSRRHIRGAESATAVDAVTLARTPLVTREAGSARDFSSTPPCASRTGRTAHPSSPPPRCRPRRGSAPLPPPLPVRR